MKLLSILFAMTMLVAVVLVAADPEGYSQYSATDLKARVDKAKPDDHKVRLDRVANWGNHSLLAIRREGDGEAEVHDTQVDVIFVKSGEGTLVLGGTVVEPRTTGPGEIRGKSIMGGVRKKMAAGDVIHVPAKIPHQMLVPKSLTFEVVKVDSNSPGPIMSRVRSIIVCGLLLTTAAYPQTVRRTADGKPDLNGIWQALNTAAWDIQDHTGQSGVPPGQGVVEGNTIPYQPSAATKKKANFANRATADPTDANCFLPGVPRATYMPFPFQIAQTPKDIAIIYEFAHALRNIPMDGSPHPDGLPDTWMGDSRGRWDGDTLMVDVNSFNNQTWFDHAGNFHSDALHVVERYTLANPDHISYEATVEDPKVFTRPWKMNMPLYRKIDKNAKLLEYECVFYQQEEKFKNAPFK